MEKPPLTTGDIAKHCGVNFRTVIRWIERGRLKAYQLPGRGDNRVRAEDFMVFLRDNQMPVPAEFLDKQRRVLVVEDDPVMARAIERVLKRAGYETRTAMDGFRAGVLLGDFQPSVVTLDLRLPGLGGLEVLKFIRSTEHFSNVRILVVSGMPQDELNKALQTGADDILGKPFDNEILLKKVEQLV